ncbi:nitronate monooxygenase [Glaciecola punicea ACAM 611]|uniref:Nitronate monooxygenase n=1 Tax=Glaciecola punicea ACAM 611 TaxID=1121923 RepID=H5TBY2_9ALTE|nr:nitronate monooxygenase family protein [Glaciecola punicea]GAB55809.1 nitronate monooxygenase [Glaciecola punicea ACAM 611]
MKTRITEMFGIRYPIIQGGMMWVGRAELAAAVSNAGGLGILTALTQATPELLRQEIRRCSEMTDKPFGVNLTILPSIKPIPYDEYLQAAVECGVKVIETAGRNPERFIPYLRANNVKVIHKCTSVRHAVKAEKVGCDAVSVDGFECAGHPGEDDVTNLVLIPCAAAKLSIPIVASGGIATGSQMAAAMLLGAEGINMGSRFVATKEAPVHHNMKQAMVDADERQTTLMFRSLNNTVRVFKNTVSKAVVEIEAKAGNTDFNELQPLVAGVRGRERCIEGGDVDDGIWTVGMVMGLIDDIPSCQVLIDRMVAEAHDAMKQRLSWF